MLIPKTTGRTQVRPVKFSFVLMVSACPHILEGSALLSRATSDCNSPGRGGASYFRLRRRYIRYPNKLSNTVPPPMAGKTSTAPGPAFRPAVTGITTAFNVEVADGSAIA
jgi:hypothetical protein